MKGYVYALINPSLPNLVKVGQTTKTPEERAKELSSATGVPTPFTIGYSIFVSNSQEAERMAHELLSQQGFRATDNREFFRAPLQQVVRVLIAIENKFQEEDSDFNKSNCASKDLDDIEFIIHGLLDEGLDYLLGNDNVFEDHYSAEEKFLAARRLGSNDAKYWLGTLYSDKYSKLYNPKKAAEFLVEAYNSGAETYSCLDKLADLFVKIGQTKNADLAYEKLFKDEQLNKVFLRFEEICLIDASEFKKKFDLFSEDITDPELFSMHESYKNGMSRIFSYVRQKEIAGISIMNALRMLMKYFHYFDQGEVRLIGAPLLYKLLPILRLLSEMVYENWPESMQQSALRGLDRYEYELANEIEKWKINNPEFG